MKMTSEQIKLFQHRPHVGKMRTNDYFGIDLLMCISRRVLQQSSVFPLTQKSKIPSYNHFVSTNLYMRDDKNIKIYRSWDERQSLNSDDPCNDFEKRKTRPYSLIMLIFLKYVAISFQINLFKSLYVYICIYIYCYLQQKKSTFHEQNTSTHVFIYTWPTQTSKTLVTLGQGHFCSRQWGGVREGRFEVVSLTLSEDHLGVNRAHERCSSEGESVQINLKCLRSFQDHHKLITYFGGIFPTCIIT